MHLGEQPFLVLKLEVRAQTWVKPRAELSALRVVVHALGMEEAGNAAIASDHPTLWQEALEQVGLLSCQQGVVLARVQKRLRRLRLLDFPNPRIP